MSEVKHLILRWDDNVMAEFSADYVINHLKWVIELLENPPQPYLIMEWENETAEFNFISMANDPLTPENPELGRLTLTSKPND
jgi:hypothetical protein